MTSPSEEAAAVETAEEQCELTPGDGGTARLWRTTAEGIMSIDLVSAVAGDREESARSCRADSEMTGLFNHATSYELVDVELKNRVVIALVR